MYLTTVNMELWFFLSWGYMVDSLIGAAPMANYLLLGRRIQSRRQ